MTLLIRDLNGVVVTKECSKCRCFLPAAEFTKAKWLEGGLRSDCKKCRKIKSQNLNLRDFARSMGLTRYTGKVCRRCGGCERRTGNGACIRCLYEARKRDKEGQRARRQRYYRDHYDRVIANVKSRKHAKIRRVPPWLTADHKRQIEAIYREAQHLTKISGVQMHVDHIVPLQGKTVSGLHVPWNLQILSKDENLTKNNKWSNAA